MVAKSPWNRLEMPFGPCVPGPNSPHLVYANLEFDGSAIPKGSRRLLRYLDWFCLLPSSWTEESTLHYLEKHQEEFRNCWTGSRKIPEWISGQSKTRTTKAASESVGNRNQRSGFFSGTDSTTGE